LTSSRASSVWTIEVLDTAKLEISALPRRDRKRILDFIYEKLPHDPERIGSPLSEAFEGFWRYRVGQYRIICQIVNEALVVLVVRVGSRSDVYRAPLDVLH
jgi:mRNA interferase RelE/StbE